jgi:hypothetical protein
MTVNAAWAWRPQCLAAIGGRLGVRIGTLTQSGMGLSALS